MSGDTAVGQFGVVLGQLPGRGRGRVTCEDGTRDSQRIVDADDRERTEIVTGVGHFGVAGGLGGTSSPVVAQDSATDAVTDNGIAMCLHIIYDCAGQSLNRSGWQRLRHLARPGATAS